MLDSSVVVKTKDVKLNENTEGCIDEKGNSIQFKLENSAIVLSDLMHNTHDHPEPENETEVDSSKGINQKDGEEDGLGKKTSQSLIKINLDELT